MTSPKAYIQAYIIHYYDPTGFAVGEAKKGSLATNIIGPWQINAIFFFFFWGGGHTFFIVTRKEGKKKERRSKKKKTPKTFSFKHIKKNSAHPLFGARKAFKNALFRKSDHESVTMGKCPLTWDDNFIGLSA